MFAEFMETYGLSLIGAILTAVFGFLGIALKRMAQKYLDTREKRRVARSVVEFVEQVYKGAGGEEKLAQALAAAEQMLEEQGIAFNALEMRVLIESALAQLNEVFERGLYEKAIEAAEAAEAAHEAHSGGSVEEE